MTMKNLKNIMIKLAIKRIKEGKERSDFLLEMYTYWTSAKEMLDKREKKWLLQGLPE